MLNKTRGLFVSLAMLALTTGPAFSQTQVTVGSVGGVDPGSSVQVPVDITGATAAAGVNWKITYDAAKVNGNVTSADGAGLGNHTLTSNDAISGDLRGVIYNTSTTENFQSDGTLAMLTVNVPANMGNGDTIDLTVDTDYAGDGIASAISDASGATIAGTFNNGVITVSTPFPLAVTDFSDWSPYQDGVPLPWDYQKITGVLNGSNQPTIQNSNPSNDPTRDGYRTFGFWESRGDLVPFYNKDTLVMTKFTITSNKSEATNGADIRFRGAVLGEDPNTFATLPEYQISVPQGRPGTPVGPPSNTLPTSTPRDYNFFWSTDDVAPTKNYKRLVWDMIAFSPGLPTDLVLTMTDFKAMRYDLTKVEAASSEIVSSVDFTDFAVGPTGVSTRGLFHPDDWDNDIAGIIKTWNTPAMSIENAGNLGAQALVYTWPGGSGRPGNDEVVAWIDTGATVEGALSSKFTDVTVKENSLYLVDFWVEAVGAGMTNRENQPNHRYRVNLWPTGEAWLVTAQSYGTAVSTAAAGDADWTKIRVYVMTNGTLEAGYNDPLSLAFDANNFTANDVNSSNAGDYKVRRIRVAEVVDFFTQAADGNWEIN